MIRARLRMAAAALWVVACVVAAAENLGHPENAPILGAHPDCAHELDLELARLRPWLPERGVLGFVGPRRERGCDPMFIAQYALAPIYIVELEHARHRADLAARGVHLVPADPPLVLVWGAEGERWLASHSGYRPLGRPAGPAQLVTRAR